MQHTKVLSGDEYEGRGPGTKGEELTVKYLTEQYQRLGLKPGNPDGTYVQKVPLAGMTGNHDRFIHCRREDDGSEISRRTTSASRDDLRPSRKLRIPIWFSSAMA